MKQLELEWRSYRNEVMSENASWVQITESKRAFFAGARSVFTIMMEKGVPGTAGESQLIADLSLELDAFLRDVKNGKA